MNCIRVTGRVSALADRVQSGPVAGTAGVAHTRWATHGVPSERNAHPHVSHGVAVVHNGIVENHARLRARLEQLGYVFRSETDTEVIAHLIHSKLGESANLLEAVRAATNALEGAYAIGVVVEGEPAHAVVARRGSPLVLGLAADGIHAASDASVLLRHTRALVHLHEGDLAEIGVDRYRVTRPDGRIVLRLAEEATQDDEDPADLAGFRHHMAKEIHAQPAALARTLALAESGFLPELFGPEAPRQLEGVERVLILACGTSYHAGLVARHWLESVAGVPAAVEIASEFRYRNALHAPDTLVVAISQSGETADTLGALQHAQRYGMPRTLAICNVAGSAIMRESAMRFLTLAGLEVGVASTKAFTAQLAALALLALTLARLRGRFTPEQEIRHRLAIRRVPEAVEAMLGLAPRLEPWAEEIASRSRALFLGRGAHWPIAMEGALKLKEITYMHAEAYAGGELKHGPLALVDADTAVVASCPADPLLVKLKGNLAEVSARGGEVFAITDADGDLDDMPDLQVLRGPAHAGLFAPLIHAVPLQLLAYQAACWRGTDIDRPRNLAKSVTVE